MKITLGENVFPLRADMLAIKNAQDEHGVEIQNLDGGSLVQVGTMMYHFARRGCEVQRVSFELSLDDFLGLIEVSQIEYLAKVLSSLMEGDTEKKT
jgi:hypothetical protein